MTLDLFGSNASGPRVQGIVLRPARSHDEWLTPPDLLSRLGPFDTDPCAPVERPWPTATQHWTIADDGLRQPWTGLVWCNPPFSTAARWIARLIEHGNGILLLHARTDTRIWHSTVFPNMTGLLFLRGRVHFHRSNGKRADGNSGAPVVLVAFGDPALQRLRRCADLGALLVADPLMKEANAAA